MRPGATRLRRAWAFVRSGYRRASARAIAALTSANVVDILLGLASTIVAARILGPRGLGVATLIMSVPQFVLTLMQARASLAVMRYLSTFTAADDPRRALATCKLGYFVDIGIAGLTFIVIAAASSWIESAIVHEDGIRWLLLLYAAALVPSSLRGSSQAILYTVGKYTLSARTIIVCAVARSAAIITLVAVGAGFAGVVIGNVVGLVAVGTTLCVLGHREVRRHWAGSWLSARIRELGDRLREIRRFLLVTTFTETLAICSRQLDIVLLGALSGPTNAGLYRLGKSTARVMVVGNPLQSVTFPRLSRLIDNGRKAAYRSYMRKVHWTGLAVGGAALAGVPLMPFVLPAVVGSSFDRAVPVAQILLAGSAISLMLFWLQPVYLALHRIKAWTVLSSIQAVALLAGFPIVIEFWGIVGLAAWLAGVQIVYQLAAVLWLRLRPPFSAVNDQSTGEQDPLSSVPPASSVET